MQKKKMLKIAGLWLALGLLGAGAAPALNYYVSLAGNDAHDGLTPATAKRTVQAAVDAAADGDTVLVHDGVYELAATLEVNKGVAVRSINGRALTILDGMAARRCVALDHASARLEGFTVRRGRADDDEGVDSAAGILNTQGVVDECLITDNFAVQAGGIMNGPAGILINSEITRNTALSLAGGVLNEGVVSNCLVAVNGIAELGYAAGIFNAPGGMAQNCVVVSNGLGMGAGMTLYAGGIFNEEGTVRQCQVAHNKALLAGGVLNADGLVEHCLIEHNEAETGGGVWNDGYALLRNSVVRYNIATLWLGMGDGSAGGIYNDYDAETRNCLAVGNQALFAGGVLSDGLLYNCTIIGNQALALIGGLANYDTAFNCIVWDNTAPSFPDIFTGESAGDIQYSCLPVVVVGVGNITNNPALIDPGSGFGSNHRYGDYRLAAGSPCENAAWTADWMLEPGATDLDGNPRIIGGAPDIGAYEYLAPPTALSASDGTYADRVLLTWHAPTPAPVYYEVWRATTNDHTQSAWLADTAALSFDDAAAVPGVLYHYWVRPVVAGHGAFSASDAGWRALTPPADLTAGSGQDTDAVRLTWTPVSGAVSYVIYRGISADFGAASAIGAPSAPMWVDTDATPGVRYCYWVRATGTDFESAPGALAVGWRRSMASTQNAWGDIDGDGLMDLLAYNPQNGGWNMLLSSNGYQPVSLQLGGRGYVPAPGDYDGDGRTDPAVYQESNGEWAAFLRDGDFWRVKTHVFGGPGWQAVPGDYDGDGRTDLALYHRAVGEWRGLLSAGGYRAAGKQLGGAGWLPAPADYDGDGKTDLAVYNPTTGACQFMFSRYDYAALDGLVCDPGRLPVSADYDGDGYADPAVYHAGTGAWTAWLSASGHARFIVYLGGMDWWPLPGDYDGDGQSDVVVYNMTSGAWQGLLSGSGYELTTYQFGGHPWMPVH